MTYDEIVALAKAYADRSSDAEIIDNIDFFIIMAEVKINRLLKTSEASTRATVLTLEDKEYYSLPTDYNGLRDVELQLDTKRATCSYVSPEQMNIINNTIDPSGYYYTIIAGNLHILPIQEASTILEIVYYAKLDNLTTSSSGYNWLSADYPDIYLAAIMVEISSFIKNGEAAMLWAQRVDKAVIALSNSE